MEHSHALKGAGYTEQHTNDKICPRRTLHNQE